MTNTNNNEEDSNDNLEYGVNHNGGNKFLEIEEYIPNKANDSNASKRATTKPAKSKGPPKLKSKRKSSTKGPRKKRSRLLKYGSLFLLIAQNVGLVLLMRYSRTTIKKDDDQLYLASTAVFLMECMKFAICISVVFFQGGSSFNNLIKTLFDNVWNNPNEVLKLCVPSFLYTVQNNLLYCALTNLDAATYQVCYQLKSLTTAIFSVILLKRTFSKMKWFALVILTLGVMIVQYANTVDSPADLASTSSKKQNHVLGIICVLSAACTSGFSGVYFEKILKGSTTSLWIRNIQMSIPSIIIAFMTIYIEDSSVVKEKGFFVGYSPIVWTVVSVQAVGGLIVAVVVKYADNVMKVFASAIAIIVSCIVSAFLFHFRPTFQFCFGTLLVMIATVLYGRPELKKKRGNILPIVRKESRKKSMLI